MTPFRLRHRALCAIVYTVALVWVVLFIIADATAPKHHNADKDIP